MSIDPGPHTGVVTWDGERTWSSTTLDFTQEAYAKGNLSPHGVLWRYLQTHAHGGDTIVLEKFEYQKDKARTRHHLNYDAAEYVGTVKTFVAQYGGVPVKLVLHSPSQAVGDNIFWLDSKLKRIGLHRPGRKHENDAMRHLLYYVTFTLKDNRFLEMLR